MQERETCAGCRFYDPDLDLRREVSPLLGFCRRHPPAPAALKARDTFPKVRCNDWCGDFEASGQKADNTTGLSPVEPLDAFQYLVQNIHRISAAKIDPRYPGETCAACEGLPEQIIFTMKDD